MVKATERPVLLHMNGKKIGLPEPETTEIVDVQRLHLGRLRGLFIGNACLREPDQEMLIKTKTCLLMSEGE